MSNRILIFSKICAFDELTCFICTFDQHEKRDRSAPSDFHHRILKCRILIFSMSEILAAPNLKNSLQLYVIFQRNTIDNVTLQERLDKNMLRVLQSTEVNADIFESCLKYTLIAKMAPLWNQIEINLLVRERDFLHTNRPLDAVTINIFMLDESVMIEIKCLKVRLSPIHLDDLDVANNTLDYFNHLPNAILSETSLLDQWVHVLPSLKKGRIISVNKELPPSSPFKNYKDLRRHWKNIYGYRLPEDNSEVLFFEVHFRPLGPQLFTYPSICLQSNIPLRTVPSPDIISSIGETFLCDVRQCLSRLLGYSTDFHYFHKKDMNDDRPISNILSPLYCLKKENFTLNDFQIVENTHLNTDNSFTQSISLCTPTQNMAENKYKPKFLPKKNIYNSQKTLLKQNELQDLEDCQIIKNNSDTIYSHNEIFKSVDLQIPKFTSHLSQKRKVLESPEDYKEKSVEVYKEKSPDFYNGKSPKVDKKHHFIDENLCLSGTSLNASQKFATEQNVFNSTPPSSNQSKHNMQIMNNNEYEVFGIITCTDNNSQTNHTKLNGIDSVESILQNNLQILSQSCIETTKPGVKKPKAKNINFKVDIPLLANTDPKGLEKLNIPTLYTWLRSQNVYVTTKMLKKQLLDKLYEHLNLEKHYYFSKDK